MTSRRVFGTASAGSTNAVVYGSATVGTGTTYGTNIVNWLNRDGLVTFTVNVEFDNNNGGNDMAGSLSIRLPGMPLPLTETITPIVLRSPTYQIGNGINTGGGLTNGYIVNTDQQTIITVKRVDYSTANTSISVDVDAATFRAGHIQITAHYFTN